MTLWTKYKGLAMLAGLLIVTPLIVWQYALSGTIEKWHTARKQSRQIVQLRDASVIARPQVAMDKDMILGGELVAVLLPRIKREGLYIEHFSPSITSDVDGVRLVTGELTVRGGFVGMVKLLDEIEHTIPHCKIISASYKTTRPRNRNATKTLGCTIYIQQITVNE